jgi:hypothetical protein
LLNQSVSLQYKAGIWYVVGDDLPLSQLDLRYSPLAGSTSIVTLGTVVAGTWNATAIGVAKLGSGTPAAGKYLDGAGTWTTLPASGLAVGSAVSGGGANRVLFEDASSNLATTSAMTWTTSGGFRVSDGSVGTAQMSPSGVISGYEIDIQGGSNFFGLGGLIVGSASAVSWRSDAGFGSPDARLQRAAAGVIRADGGSSTSPGGLSSPANTPTQLAAGANNYAPGAGQWQRWNASTPVNVTGMVAGQPGESRTIANVGTSAITLTNQDAASTAANRWLTTTGADIVLGANKLAWAIYDATTAAWRVSLLP